MKTPAILLLLAFAGIISSCNRITEGEAPPPPDGEASATIRLSYDSTRWSDSTWRDGSQAPQLERQHKAWFQVVLDGDYAEVDSLIVRWGDGQRSTLTAGRVLGHSWDDTGANAITATVWIDGYRLADTSFPIHIVNRPPRPILRDSLRGRTTWNIDSTLSCLRPAATEGTEKTFFDFDFNGNAPTWDDTVAAGTMISWKWPVPAGADTTRSVRIVERVVDDLGAEASDTISIVLRVAPPRIKLRAAADTVRLGDTIRISAHPSAPRGLDSLLWKIDGAAKTASSRDSLLVFPATRPGATVISAQAVDAKGVRGPADTVRIHVRGAVAIASIAGPDSAYLRDTVEFKALTAPDAPQGIRWTWKIDGQIVDTGTSIRRAFQKPNAFQVTVIAALPGLPSDSMSRTLRILDRAPVVDSVTGVRALLAHQTTRLCAWAHDPDRDAIAWRWFRAGSSAVLDTSACFDFAPPDTGTFEFLAKAGDPWGKTGSKSIRIEVGAERLAVDAGKDTSLNYGIALPRRAIATTNLVPSQLSMQWIVVLPRLRNRDAPDTIRVAGAAFPDSLLLRMPGLYTAIFEARSDSIGIRAVDTARITVLNRRLIPTIALLDPADTLLAQDDTARLVIRVVDPDSAMGDVYWKWIDKAGVLRYDIYQDSVPPVITAGTLVDTLFWRVDTFKTIGRVAFTAHVWDRFHDLSADDENSDTLVEPVPIAIVDSTTVIDLWDPNPVLADSLRKFQSCFYPPPGRTLIRYEWSLDDTAFLATPNYAVLTSIVSGGRHVLRIKVTDDAGNASIDSISFLAAGHVLLPDTIYHDTIDRFEALHPFDAGEALCAAGAAVDHSLGFIKFRPLDPARGTVLTGWDGKPGDPLTLDLSSRSACSGDIIATFLPDSGFYDIDPRHPAAGFRLVVDNGVFKDTVWMALPIRYVPPPPTIRFVQPPPASILEGEEFAIVLDIAPPAEAPAAKWELLIEGLPDHSRFGSMMADQVTQWNKMTGYPFLGCPPAGPCRIPMDSLNGNLRIDLDTNYDGDLGIRFRAVAFETRDGAIFVSDTADLPHTIHSEAVASQPTVYSLQKDIKVPDSLPIGLVDLNVNFGTQDPSERIDTIRIDCEASLGACPLGIRILDARGQALDISPDGGWIYSPLVPAPPGIYTFSIELPTPLSPGTTEVTLKATATVREISNSSTNSGEQRFTIQVQTGI